jgi:hypothetical protein
MEAKELRIGNYFYDRGNKVLRLDWWEDINKLSSDMSVDGIKVHPMTEHIGKAKPIPLTKDWLVNLGFVSDDYGEYNKGPYTLDQEYTDKGIYNFVINEETCLDIDIKYVHQLQNLYFALTNVEL